MRWVSGRLVENSKTLSGQVSDLVTRLSASWLPRKKNVGTPRLASRANCRLKKSAIEASFHSPSKTSPAITTNATPSSNALVTRSSNAARLALAKRAATSSSFCDKAEQRAAEMQIGGVQESKIHRATSVSVDRRAAREAKRARRSAAERTERLPAAHRDADRARASSRAAIARGAGDVTRERFARGG